MYSSEDYENAIRLFSFALYYKRNFSDHTIHRFSRVQVKLNYEEASKTPYLK